MPKSQSGPAARILPLFILLAFTAASMAPGYFRTSAVSPLAITPLNAATKVPLPVRKLNQPDLAEIEAAAKALAARPHTVNLQGELAELNKIELSKDDEDNLNKAMKELYRDRETSAQSFADKIKDPIAKKLVNWYRLRNGDLDHSQNELREFLDNNPGFPSRSSFKAKIERKFLNGNIPHKLTIEHFDKQAPATLTGKVAYAEALKADGQNKKATSLIRDVYHSDRLYLSLERRILSRHEADIRKQDHFIRVDRLLYQGRRSKIAAAMRAAKNIDKADREGALFRAAVIRRRYGTAKKMLAKLSAEVKSQPGVYLSRVELLRRTKNPKDAAALISKARFNPDTVHEKDEWWQERRIHTRRAIARDDYKTAYAIASGHENPTVNHYNEAEFLAGWIALRFLDKPKQAKIHFEKFKKAADGPRTRSKSGYWLARTHEVLQNRAAATENYRFSATHFNTYYGQLAAQELNKTNSPIILPEPPTITAEIVKGFTAHDEVKALIMAHLAGQNTIVRLFFAHLRYHYKDTAELTLLAELAATLGYNQSTVRIGKTAMSYNHPLATYAYPVRFMPEFKPLRSIPERALIYAVARQESEFNDRIKSHAGARGLMQVMPRTLLGIARKYKIKRNTAWLTQRPAYNAAVGSAYIGDRHDEFNGSYIMTFAGFNAGPGRVRQWIREFGDPRTGKIDPIDWVERIPFSETRNYVQKVLANVQVYRARLGTGKAMIKSQQDLERGKF